MDYIDQPIELEFFAPYQLDGYYALPLYMKAAHEDGKSLFELDEDGNEIVPDDVIYLDDDRDTAERILALRLHLDDWDSNVSVDGNNTFGICGEDYLVLTDDEADEAWNERLDQYIDDCMEIPEHLVDYFDRDAWKSDARIDGRGQSLSSYDGCEHYQITEDSGYYLYRV